MYDSVDIAKYILLKASDKKIEVNTTKINKFVYICNGLLLALGKEDIKENARAWSYGPVYPKVYKWFSNEKKDCAINEQTKSLLENDSVLNDVISTMFEVFGGWSATELSSWSHRPDSPWAKAMRNNNGILNGIIEKSDMKDYFTSLLSA